MCLAVDLDFLSSGLYLINGHGLSFPPPFQPNFHTSWQKWKKKISKYRLILQLLSINTNFHSHFFQILTFFFQKKIFFLIFFETCDGNWIFLPFVNNYLPAGGLSVIYTGLLLVKVTTYGIEVPLISTKIRWKYCLRLDPNIFFYDLSSNWTSWGISS